MELKLEEIGFHYPGRRRGEADVPVLEGVALDVREGEFFTLLGPSGCGKTTLLWLLAGFLTPTRGRILFEGRDVAGTPPERRSVGIVFQNYALFPHLSVFENVAFGLKSQREAREQIRARVTEALELVNLAHLASRRPSELSGGQQQRIALARAIAPRPRLLLMDEPLSNLDAALRVETRGRLRELQHALGVTTIYVTHDQEEAMSMSDRMAILNEGHLLQTGSPEELYERPESRFVAAFLGRCNLLPVEAGPDGAVRLADGSTLALESAGASGQGERWLAVRPEHIAVRAGEAETGALALRGRLQRQEYLGDQRVLHVAAAILPDRPLEIALHGPAAREPFEEGGDVEFRLRPEDCRLVAP